MDLSGTENVWHAEHVCMNTHTCTHRRIDLFSGVNGHGAAKGKERKDKILLLQRTQLSPVSANTETRPFHSSHERKPIE